MTQYSCFIGLWLVGSWLRPGSPEALLVFPSRSSGNSTLGRSHTWKQCVDHIGRGSSGYARKIELFPLTLVSYSTVLELIGNELGPQYLAQEPAWGTRVQLGLGSRKQGRAKGWPPLRGSYGKGSKEALRLPSFLQAALILKAMMLEPGSPVFLTLLV